jgi:hypothetical protein
MEHRGEEVLFFFSQIVFTAQYFSVETLPRLGRTYKTSPTEEKVLTQDFCMDK